MPGPEGADTLVAHLPPTTWQDIATKDELRILVADLRTEFRVGLADVRTDVPWAIDRQMRWMVTFICAWKHSGRRRQPTPVLTPAPRRR